MKLTRSKKGVEMTGNVVIIIVLALIVIAVLLYIFLGKSRIFSDTASCPPEDCAVVKSCADLKGPDYVKGFAPCSKEVDKKKRTGRCCVKDELS
jgi:hypothetical protein